jgi:hypothetical protein
LKVPILGHTQALQKLYVIATTTQEYMLAVVHRDASFLVNERKDPSTKEVPRLYQSHPVALVQ